MKFLGKIAHALHRRPHETRQLLSVTNVVGKSLLLLAILVPLVALVGIYLSQVAKFQASNSSSVPIQRESWRVLFRDAGDGEKCALTLPQNPKCIAAPESPLWTSAHRRTDPDHVRKMKNVAGKVFWIGTVIPQEDLKKAHARGANHIIIGYINADSEVWIDGARQFVGTYADSHFPIITSVSVARLAEPRDLHLAMRIEHTSGAVFPEAFGYFRQEGLATPMEADEYLRAEVYEEHTRLWFFFGTYFIFGTLFLMLWVCNLRKVECAYLATYAFFQALIQTLSGDFTTGLWNVETANRIAISVAVFEGAFALFLGMAFSRMRRIYFEVGIPIFLVAGAVLFFRFPDTVEAGRLSQWLSAKFVPFCYLLGAVACFLQSFWLDERQRERKGMYIRRSRRLLLFGNGLAAIGIGYSLQQVDLSVTYYMVWPRFMNVVMALYLAAVVLADYTEAEKLLEQSPVSDFHRRPQLPECLSGVLLVIDLKKSEGLIRTGAARGDSGELVNLALSHMWTAVTRHQGNVLQTEGDSLMVFFDYQGKRDPIVRALYAVEKVVRRLDTLTEQFIQREFLPKEGPRLQFRAAMVMGDVKPIWHQVGASRFPGWVAVGSTNAFLEAMRLLELENGLDPERASSNVMMPEPLAETLEKRVPPEKLHWLRREAQMEGKHGQLYHVAAMTVGVRPRKRAA